MVKELYGKNYSEIINSTSLSIVDFKASWCGPCQMLAPVLNQLSEDISGVGFYSVDIDEQRELAAKNGVELVPTVLLIKDGKTVEKSVGFKDYDAMKRLIEKHM